MTAAEPDRYYQPYVYGIAALHLDGLGLDGEADYGFTAHSDHDGTYNDAFAELDELWIAEIRRRLETS